MVDGFSVLLRVARLWRARGMTSGEIEGAFVALEVCSPEYAFLITRAVAVDSYMTELDQILYDSPFLQVDELMFSLDPLSEDPAPECHQDE